MLHNPSVHALTPACVNLYHHVALDKQQAESESRMSDRRQASNGINLLILEGGGARGLSSLIILDELMTRLGHYLELEDQPLVRDHFDIVAGTGTGAVIACMVGRLGMSIQRAIQCYVKLAEVFSERKRIGTTTYKTTKLQAALKGMVRDITGDENTRMMDTKESDKCRTMVFAMSAHNMNAGLPCIFRSYQGVSNQMPDSPIWKVLSATMAQPEMFKPIEIGPDYLRQSFVDGGFGCNNPTAHVLAEVKAIMSSRDLSSIICIGSGHPDTIQLPQRALSSRFVPTNVLSLTKNIAVDAERVAQEMEVRFQSTADVYFRFSVDQGMQNVEVGEWEKLEQVTANAQAYLRGLKVSKSVDVAVAAIKARKAAVNNCRIDGVIQTSVPDQTIGYKACPAPTPVFTGRRDTIDRIIACISKGNTQRCVFVLYGLGGSGKTQLALKTVQQTKDIWSDVVFVDATTNETAIAALAGFAKEKNVGDSHESALRWLSKRQERWLMIIDNADDPDVDIRQYTPDADHGSILVTTRIKQHVALARGDDSDYRVSEMEPEEAMEALLKAAKTKYIDLSAAEREAARRLLKDLGYLALAIVQAGAYIFSSGCSFTQYWDMFTRHHQNTLESASQLPIKMDEYQKSVYTTWHMSYELLGIDAKRLLHLMAFMHHADIVEDIFRRCAIRLRTYEPEIPATESEKKIHAYVTECLAPYLDKAGAWDSHAFRNKMTVIASYSLINYDKVNSAYTLHILVHDWASTVISHPIDMAVEHTAFLLAVSIDYEDTMESLNYKRVVETHVSRLLQRQEGPSANNAPRFAEVYLRSGKWSQQERLYQICLYARQEKLGREHDATLDSTYRLAYAYQQQGRYREAVGLQEELVEIRKRVSGAESRDTLLAMRDLASTYYYLGRYTNAQSLHQHILDTSTRVHGHDHPDTLLSMHELAVTYQAQGRYDQAEALLLKVVDARKRVSGDEHPETLNSMHVLASTYYRQGRYDEAESMQEHVVEVRKRRQGDEHPNTLSTMGNLALTYLAKGRYGEAEELGVKVLEAMKRVYGEGHPETLISMLNLAGTYYRQDRYEKAEELQKRVVEEQEHALGAGHPHRLLSMRHLLATYHAMGESRRREYNTLEQQIKELEGRAG
ncbi:kinesin light chain [Ceratobasidium sp. AG-Ba]|nr:kinesin light chain [Ceratobasidium sp. AG-Ba]